MGVRKVLRWKLKEHRWLLAMGIRHSLLRDAISSGYRRKSFLDYNEQPRNIAKTMGCIFSERTPGPALIEIFVEQIYSVNGFIPSRGETVVDVGASFGYRAIYWSNCCGAHVIAFEPLVNVFALLQEKIKLNSANVSAFNLALGDGTKVAATDESDMLSSDHNSGNSATFTVSTHRLDDFHLESLDLLKIDVEGFELSVLKGAWRSISKFKPRIIVETHSTSLREAVQAEMDSIGYDTVTVGRTLRGRGWMDEVTNLFFAPHRSQCSAVGKWNTRS